MVVVVAVVWTAEPCLIMVVGVMERASRDAPGACRKAGDVFINDICQSDRLPAFSSLIYS